MSLRIIAVDWSGDRNPRNAREKIWLAEAVDGRLARLENGRDRDQVAEHLVAVAAESSRLIVGLDFAFSLPAWFFEDRGLRNAYELWTLVEAEGEDWLAGCPPPFWGRHPGPMKRPPLPAHFRRTEESLRGRFRAAGLPGGPTSVFQLVGPSQVGPGSLRGMRLLRRLHQERFSVWPFDRPGWPCLVEIYPRLLTGQVVKSDAMARMTYLGAHYPSLSMEHRLMAASSSDAFDAAISALVMARHVEELEHLPAAIDATEKLEGAIWAPQRNWMIG
ncbi:MAG: hypothetical protein AB7I33_14875 [Gemmatimonadales bacterium]